MIHVPALQHDTEAELWVLGCLFQAAIDGDDARVDEIFESLVADDFFAPEHKALYAAAESLRSDGQPIDARVTAKRTGDKNAMGLALEALHSIASTRMSAGYVKAVADAARQRKIVCSLTDALKQARHGGGTEVIEGLRRELDSLRQSSDGAKLVTGAAATEEYMRYLSGRDTTLPRMALPDLDYALGGGVDYGEMIVLAARPSHGKTAVALQCVHNWTADGMAALYVSLEMSASALGKRIMQFSSEVPEEDWRRDMTNLRCDVERYHDQRAEWFIADSMKTIDKIAREVERSVRHRGIKACVIDYAQLIQSPGKSRYEQITHTSTVLRGLASEHRLVMLVLCQMSREIEARKKFVPVMSDIKESGQFEQDADVVVFLVWPHRIDSTQPAHEYQFFVAKNRNRPILSSAFTARFEPSRQRVVSPTIRDMPNYEPAFDDYDPFAA